MNLVLSRSDPYLYPQGFDKSTILPCWGCSCSKVCGDLLMNRENVPRAILESCSGRVFWAENMQVGPNKVSFPRAFYVTRGDKGARFKI